MTPKLLDEDDIRRALTRISHEILERDKGAGSLVLVRRMPPPISAGSL